MKIAPHVSLRLQLAWLETPFSEEFRFHPVRRWRADFYIPSGRLLIEIEGGGFVQGRHSRGVGMRNDCEKYAEAMMLGYQVLRVVPDQIDNGKALEWIRKLISVPS